MLTDKLGIYLNDHLMGATSGVGLVQRIADRNRRSVRGPELRRIAEEITEDREALLDLMATLDVPVRRYKICAGWMAERAGRLKSNGAVCRRSGLSALVELEALRLGVEGKALLWATLLVAVPADSRLDASRLGELQGRAQRQIDALETMRRSAAGSVFAGGTRRVGPDSD
ncbi:hypothetical protein [Streptomyces sp. NBC_00388]|uniref:hypothetical protein n=1 Tax=Streptomyces sp. NBC_00388 TaxID=2975735 RepID=UPI002E1AAD69